MAKTIHPFSRLLLFLFLLSFAALVIQGAAAGSRPSVLHLLPPDTELHFKGVSKGWVATKNSRRFLIGSVAPSCTYNECKGCKSKCRAEQVPVEGNDPINSPYHYKCVCH